MTTSTINLENVVVELEDGVEYLIDERAAEDIKKKSPLVIVRRLYDGLISVVTLKRLRNTLKKRGVVAHIHPGL